MKSNKNTKTMNQKNACLKSVIPSTIPVVSWLKLQNLSLLKILLLITLAGCHPDDENDNPDPTENEKGYVQGVVKDTKGNPIQGASITIDNTLIYNSNLLSTTNSKGEYKVKLSGSFTWAAYAEFDKQYNGKKYTFDLDPENNEEFTSDGGVRNFQWKLKGEKPEGGGLYGSMIQLQSEFGSPILAEDVTFQLTPEGPLVDGSTGTTLTMKGGAPHSPAYFKLMDIPLGRYKVKATYEGQQLTLKNLITNEEGKELILNFEPEINLTGLWCQNCALIQYE
jgi:hypothetical protein